MFLDQLPPNSKTFLHARGERLSHSISSKPTKSNKKSHLAGTSRFQQDNSKNLKRQTETDHSEKVVYNTWFEGSDVANLVGLERPQKEHYMNGKQMIDQREKIRDYEEILQDSPKNSFSQHNLEEPAYDKEILDQEGPESIEDLITNIDEIMKMSQASKKPSHKRGISHALNPKNGMQQRRLIHQSSMLMDSPDLDSIFNSYFERTSSKKFDKLDTTRLTKFYSEQKNARSSLSTSLQRDDTGQVRELTTQLGISKAKKKNIKDYRVYFFNSNLALDIPINTCLTVGEVIRQIMDYYSKSESVDTSLLKYPKDVEAYELRMLDDEDADYMDDGDAHMPDFSLPPLEKNRVFASLGLEKGVAFVENPDFKPPETTEKIGGGVNKLDLIKNYALKNKKVLVKIYFDVSNFITQQFVPEAKIKSLYRFTRNKNISERSHKFRIYKGVQTQTMYDRDDDDDDDNDEGILDDNLPLKAFQSEISGGVLQLEIIRKKFLDEPPKDPLFLKSCLFGDAEIEEIDDTDIINPDPNIRDLRNKIFIYNEVMANHYEEFNVTKIREKGKSHHRVLGIDNAKIYNLYKELKDQNAGLTNILSNLFYTKIAPKNPERPISDVIDAKILTANKFTIQYKAGSGKRKSIEYEADDPQTANKIVSKLQTIKNMEKKRKQYKQGYTFDLDST